MFIIKIFQDLKKVKRIRDNVSKYNLYLYFLIQQNLLISGKKNPDVNRTQGVRHVIYIFFRSSLGKVKCAKFHHRRICVTGFREWEPFWLPHS